MFKELINKLFTRKEYTQTLKYKGEIVAVIEKTEGDGWGGGRVSITADRVGETYIVLGEGPTRVGATRVGAIQRRAAGDWYFTPFSRENAIFNVEALLVITAKLRQLNEAKGLNSETGIPVSLTADRE